MFIANQDSTLTLGINLLRIRMLHQTNTSRCISWLDPTPLVSHLVFCMLLWFNVFKYIINLTDDGKKKFCSSRVESSLSYGFFLYFVNNGLLRFKIKISGFAPQTGFTLKGWKNEIITHTFLCSQFEPTAASCSHRRHCCRAFRFSHVLLFYVPLIFA